MAIKAAKVDNALDLEMSGVVGDGWSDDPITSKATRKALKEAGDVSTINVKLNSPGGFVEEGLEIYQMLADHPAKVIVTVGAQAQSCGSLIAMAGDEIILHETSLFLIHNPWSLAVGDYRVMGKRGAELKLMAGVFAGAYAARSGMSVDDAKRLMDEDRYLDADEAKELGFCTKIIPSKKKPTAADKKIAAMAFESMKTEARERLQRAAACALTPTTETPAPSAPAETEKKKDMAQLAVILTALCLAEGTSDADAMAHINTLKASKDNEGKLFEALGAKGADDAIGRIKGLREKAEKLDAIEIEREQEKAAALAAKKTALITAAGQPAKSTKVDPANPHAGKLVPAQKAWAESCSLETLEGWLANAPIVLVGDGAKQPVGGGSYSGKLYADMSNKERAELRASDPELFKQLRAEAQQKGLL